jgi:ferredoxin
VSFADRLAERFKPSEPPPFEIVSRRCLRSRFAGNACDRCAKECPAEAIRIEPGKITLDQKRCVGCLACTAVCPAEALVGRDSRLAAASAKVVAGRALSLCCEKGIRTGEEIVFPCLGALSGEEIAAFAVRSGKSVSLRLSGCGDCWAAAVRQILARRIQALASLPECDGLYARIKLLTTKEEEATTDQEEAASSRRAFFSAFWDISLHAATETITTIRAEPASQERHAHKHLPARLILLRQAVDDAGDEASRRAILRLFFTLLTNSDCNFCGACAGMCPTGALKNRRTEEGKQLLFAWAKCSGCGLCLEFCRKKALTLLSGRKVESTGRDTEILHEAAHGYGEDHNPTSNRAAGP